MQHSKHTRRSCIKLINKILSYPQTKFNIEMRVLCQSPEMTIDLGTATQTFKIQVAENLKNTFILKINC